MTAHPTLRIASLAALTLLATVAARSEASSRGDCVVARVTENIVHRVGERVVRRISVTDRGIAISGDTTVSDADRPLEGRHGHRHDVVDIGPHGVRIEESDDDTLRHRVTRIVGPAIVVNGDEAGLVRVFSDAEVPAGERIEGDVVAVCGSVRVDGQVSGNVVAVLGTVHLGPGAVVDGDAVAIGGELEQPQSATVNGESVSLSFLPLHWGAPGLRALILLVLGGWLVTVFGAWLFTLVFPLRMLRIATTFSRRGGASLLLGAFSAPLMLVFAILLLITVIGIPIAFLLPIVYVLAVWSGQLAGAYVLGSRLLRRKLGEGGPFGPMFAGTLFVSVFFVLAALLAGPGGAIRTLSLFFGLVGGLLIVGLSMIGTGAVLLSRFGSRPSDVSFAPGPAATVGTSTPAPAPVPPIA